MTTDVQRYWWRVKRLWCRLFGHQWRAEKEFNSCARCHTSKANRDFKRGEFQTVNLRGALGHIERRALQGVQFNEFGRESIVDFKAERRVLPSANIDLGYKTLLELTIRSAYTVFRHTDDEANAQAEENAMRALCRCLYQDVLDDLMPIMKAVGDGKRSEALRLLDGLYTRLNGRE